MKHAIVVRTFLVVLALALTSCAPPWTVIRQAAPSPFVGQPVFGIMPISFDGLTIDSHSPIPEAEYLARKTPEQQAAWETDKERLAQRVLTSLAVEARGVRVVPVLPGTTIATPFAVHARMAMIEPGSFFRTPECHMHVQITTAKGQILDEVLLRVEPNMGVVFPISAKLERMGDMLGAALARYLRERSSAS